MEKDNVQYDLGNLTIFDPSPIEYSKLLEISQENVQFLLNKIFDLPTQKEPEGILAKLPKPEIVIPREKPIPKPKPPTKWEKFARTKGINKRKKTRMVYEESGELKPRWGYKRASKATDNWIVEAKPTDDTNSDPFSEIKKKKKESIQNQKKREQKNKTDASSSGKSLPSTINLGEGVSVDLSQKKNHLERTLSMAKKSTISMGLFDKPIIGEKPDKHLRKRKNEPTDIEGETKRNMKVLENVMNKQGKTVNMDKAVNQVISEQQKRRRTEKHMKDSSKRKKK